jgi:LuxR family transcriptional regulator, maltose regulon positive regulatory protein
MTTLTRRQSEVCGYLCRGWSNKEIGAHLNLSFRTVEWHREEIFKKYRVHNAVELVREIYHLTDEVSA